MLYSNLWLNTIIPYIRRFPYNGKYARLCDENERGFRDGWLLGDVNPDNLPLNMRTYPMTPDQMGLDQYMAIAKDLTLEMNLGRIVSWFGEIKGMIPMFADPKKVCPITGEVLAYRSIRDGTCGSTSHPSLNMLTPDAAAYTELPRKMTIASCMKIMRIIWGRGFLLAKTDLATAFRQFFLACSEPAKLVYVFDGKHMADTQNIWGTRTGSRICNNFTDLTDRHFMIKENGEHLLEAINKVEDEDWMYFERLLNQQQHVPSQRDSDELYDEKKILNWDRALVRRWLRDEKLDHVEALQTVRNGVHLAHFHRDTVLEEQGKDACEVLEKLQFFDKLVQLKLDSNQLITVIVRSYVDDYMFFLLPQKAEADAIFGRFGGFLSDSGVDENEEKREMPEERKVLIGLLCDSESMDMKTPLLKKHKIKQAIYKALHLGYIMLKEYESLVGRLQHVSETAWPGKAFLRRMRTKVDRLIAKHGRINMAVILDELDRRDLLWWVKFLDKVDGVLISDMLDPVFPEDEIYFDAATNGSRDGATSWDPAIGVWYRGHWIAMKVPECYQDVFVVRELEYAKEFAIAHFEALAIVVGLHNFRDMIGKKRKIMLRTDSKHVEAALMNKSSRDPFLQSVVRWTCMFAVEEECRLYVKYIHTDSNGPADALSRRQMVTFVNLAKMQCDAMDWELQRHMHRYEVPDIHKW